MNILLIGYGKMGKIIEEIALANGHSIVGKLSSSNISELTTYTKEMVDVAIEFTHPESAFENIKYCVSKHIPVVSGSTGWLHKLPQIETLVEEKSGAFFYASNFSVGVNLFFHFNDYIASKMQQYPEYRVSMEEIHHLQKVDHPSGTAITLADEVLKNYPAMTGWINEPYDGNDKLEIVSDRKENVVGTHILRYKSPIDTIEFSHIAHSREGFAKGAVLAAEWLKGKSGIFGMKDLLNL